MVLFIRKSYKRLHTILSRGQVLSVWIEMGLAPGGGNFPEKTLGRMAVSDTSGRVSPACLVSSKSAFMHTRNLFTTMLLHIGTVWARAELWDGEGRSASYTDGATVQAQCQGLLCTCRRDKTPRLLVFLPVSLSRQKNKLLLSYQSTNQGGWMLVFTPVLMCNLFCMITNCCVCTV